MLQPERLFQNIFNDPRITSLRLSNFSTSSITKFTNADTDGRYTSIIAGITAAHEPFINGISDIDTSVGILKGKTKTVANVTNALSVYMSDYEGLIANAIGGFNSPSFLSFYPRGVSEYSRPTITQMPLLVKRLGTLATDHAVELGGKLTTELQAFAPLWQSALKEQSEVKDDIKDGRADRDTTRIDLEIALLAAIHLVATQFPGNVAKCMSFFDFSLLTGVSRKGNGGGDKPAA